MADQSKSKNGAAEQSTAQRAPSGNSPGASSGPLSPGQRWSGQRKRDVVLRMLRGEAPGSLSRELGIETYRLEKWHRKALAGIDASLREREPDTGRPELDAALKRVGELTMENELLKMRVGRPGPLTRRRSGR